MIEEHMGGFRSQEEMTASLRTLTEHCDNESEALRPHVSDLTTNNRVTYHRSPHNV